MDLRHEPAQYLSSGDRGALSHSQMIADGFGDRKTDDAFANASH
jgi:hypothetical protein